MPFLIIITSVICIFISFLSNSPYKGDNSFLGYYAGIGIFALRYWLIFIAGFSLAYFISILTLRFNKEYSVLKNYLLCLFQTISSIAVGTFFAYALLLVIAFLELNILAITIDISPKIIGITTDSKTIVTTLNKFIKPPRIIASDKDNYQELLGIATATTGTGNIYADYILPKFPSLLTLPIIEPNSSLMLIDNNLIVTKIDRKQLESVSPVIGNLFVQEYFPLRKIKAYPKVQIMTKQEFAKVRDDEFKDKYAQIDNQLKTIENDISSYSASLQTDKDQISYYQNVLDDTSKQNTSQYYTCVDSGYYKDGNFVHYNTQEYCKAAFDTLQNTHQLAQDDLQSWQKQLDSDQELLKGYQFYQQYFTAQKKVMSVIKQSIPDELGVFVPENTLQIVVNDTSPHAIADYFETVVHEYLHYASYNPQKKLNAAFFEEGLTEYFARQAIKENLNEETNLAYPSYAKIISEMAKSIPERELADIYFDKDQVQLEKKLDSIYGEGFYQKNILLFGTLQYSSDLKQALQLANTIMDHIGGNHLSLSDLQSSLSTY